jgi:hypothetical protein
MTRQTKRGNVGDRSPFSGKNFSPSGRSGIIIMISPEQIHRISSEYIRGQPGDETMKISEEFRASHSVIVDIRRWQNEITQSTSSLENTLFTLGKLVNQNLVSDKVDFDAFKRHLSEFNELVDSVRNELYLLDEIMSEIVGCDIIEGTEPTRAAQLVGKEIKALETFKEVGESYAKTLSLQLQFGKGQEMIPKNDLLSSLADLGKIDQETQNEIKIICASLKALSKHAELLGERKVA